MLAILRRAFTGLDGGSLTVTLPSGVCASYDGRRPGANAAVRLQDYGVLWRIARRGKLGFAECVMDGRLVTGDLDAVLRLALVNAAAMEAVTGRFARLGRDRRYHASRANTRQGSRRNIAAHYDLGNAFYAHWLDAGMTYSSGIHATAATSLEDAQSAKIERIAQLLDLAPGHAVLEIGCGWGSFAEAIAPRVGRFTGITISSEQHAWCHARLARSSAAGRIDIQIEDYRDTTGSFDRLVSIEMVEAVGEANWPAYFKVLADRLAPGGIGVVQAITIPERYYQGYRDTPDFIQRYIFPGGMLPTVEAMRAHAGANGLEFEQVLSFGDSYALTLRAWRARFEANWPLIAQLGFDERFRRMWNYYFAYCAAGFERGLIDVGLFRLRKPELAASNRAATP